MTRVDQALARAANVQTPGSPEPENHREPASPWNLEGEAVAAAAAQPFEPAESEVDSTVYASRLSAAVLEKLVVTPVVGAQSVEEYRRLAAVLHLTQAERGIKVIMVTSAQPGEGKTLTAVNIALTLSESYRRSVLLVDADLRRPTLHEIFQVPNVAGLNDGLKGSVDRKLALVRYSPHLAILPAGKPDPDPMSALTSDRMRRVLEEAVTRFDWVVLDTPPVGLLPDANLLGAMVDAVVLVVRAGKTPHAAIQNSVQALGRERIVGVVLNRAEAPTNAGGYELYDYRTPAATPSRKALLWRKS